MYILYNHRSETDYASIVASVAKNLYSEIYRKI